MQDQSQSESKPAPKKAEPAPILKPAEVALSPVLDICQKLRQKTLLSKDEIVAITNVLAHQFSDPKKLLSGQSLQEGGERVREYLSLVYYAILNAYTYKFNGSFLETQALIKLITEALQVVKSCLEAVLGSGKKKEASDLTPSQVAQMLNFVVPPSLSILSLFASQRKDLYDEWHYKYRRDSDINLSEGSLQHLNQVFADLAPKNNQVINEEEVIDISVTQEIVQSHPNDLLFNLMDEIPQSHINLSKSISEQVWGKRLASGNEESKQESIDVNQHAADQVQKLKLVELVSKVADHLVSVAKSVEPTEFLLLLDQDLIKGISGFQQTVSSFKPKDLTSFFGQYMNEVALRAQKETIEFLSKLKDADRIMKMEIDHIVESAQGFQDERLTLTKNLGLLSKSLEIISIRGDALGPNVMKEFIANSNNFRYLTKVIKLDKNHEIYIQGIEAIIESICHHFQAILSPQAPKLTQEESLDCLISVSSIVRAATKLTNTRKGSSKPREVESAKIESQLKDITYITGPVRTRGQLKKERGAPANKKAQAASSKVEGKPKIAIVKVDIGKLMKTSLALLSSAIIQFKSHPTSVLTQELLESISHIYKQMDGSSEYVQRLLSGCLSELMSYCAQTKDQVSMISNYLLQQQEKLLQTLPLTQFMIRYLFIVSSSKSSAQDTNLAFSLMTQAIQRKWLTSSGRVARSPYDLYTGNVNSYMLFLSGLLSLSNITQSQEQKTRLLGLCVEQLKGEGFGGILHLAQLVMLSDQSLQKIKPIVKKLIAHAPNEALMVELQADAGTLIQSIFNSHEGVYNPDLVAKVIPALSCESVIAHLKEAVVAIDQNEAKTIAISSIKQVLSFNQDTNKPVVTDLQSFIATQISIGSTDTQLTNARFDQSCTTQTQTLVQKIKSNPQSLTTQDLDFIGSLIRSLRFLSEHVYEANLIKIRQSLANPQQQELASVLLESLKSSIPSQKFLNILQKFVQKSKLNELTLNPDELNQQVNFYKANFDHLEVLIHSHCFSQGQDQTLQSMISSNLLLKSIYQSVFNIVTASANKEFQKKIQEHIETLLVVKHTHPFLERKDRNGFDFDQSDKLLTLTLEGSQIRIANRDFIKLRSFDQFLKVLALAQENVTPEIISLTSELAVIAFQNLRVSEDQKILMPYFQLEQGPAGKIFNPTLKLQGNFVTNIWQLAFLYANHPEVDTGSGDNSISREARGGLQLDIIFGQAEGGQGNKRNRKPALKKQVAEKPEEQTSPQQNKVVNQAAFKLLSFAADSLQLPDDNMMNKAFRESFIASQRSSVHLFEKLVQVNEVSLLKRLIEALLKGGDSQIRKMLQDCLVFMLQSSQTSESILLAADLAQMISTNNKELLVFMIEHVLRAAQTLDSNEHENKIAKLVVLDFVCQLSQMKFSHIENGSLQYNESVIQKRRQERQEKRNAAVDIKHKMVLSEALSHEESAFGKPTDSVEFSKQDLPEVEGFKQDYVMKDVFSNLEYMEVKGETCTFAETKKNFSMQHWYHCYTCRLVENSGCCAVCAFKCHQGHVIVYSKKSNFFCDCGSSGNCQCLKQKDAGSRNRPPHERIRRDRESSRYYDRPFHPNRGMPDGGMPPRMLGINEPLFARPPFDAGPGFNNSLRPFPGGDNPVQYFPPHFMRDVIRQQEINEPQRIFPPPEFMVDQDDRHQFLRDIMPQSIFGRPRDNSSGSSEEIEREFQPNPGYRMPQGLMQMMRGMPPQAQSRLNAALSRGSELKESKSTGLAQSESCISNVNPLEDPFSEAGQTPLPRDNDTFSLFDEQTLPDAEMSLEAQESNAESDLSVLLQSNQGIFDEIFKMLVSQVKEYCSGEQEDTEMQSQEVPRPSEQNVLLKPKKQVKLTSDLGNYTKQFNSNTFLIRIQHEKARVAISQNINLLDLLDSSNDGLVAMCEEQEVALYAGSQFFEDEDFGGIERYPVGNRDGSNQPVKVDSIKFSYQPLQVKFNPAQPRYLAVVGDHQVEVLVLTEKGTLAYKVTVDLMLEALGPDLFIANVKWLPGSQFCLAVATKSFIKIFNLAEDTLAPRHNILLFNGVIHDFAFSSSTKTSEDTLSTTIFAASSSGEVYQQKIEYCDKRASNEDQKMQGGDDHELMLTEPLVFPPELQDQVKTSCISIHSAHTLKDLLLVSFSNGITLMGYFDPQTSRFNGQKIDVQRDPSFQQSQVKQLWTRNGECMVAFREIGQNQQDESVYIQAFSRKNGHSFNATGLPLVLKISQDAVDVNILKPQGSSNTNMQYAVGLALIKRSTQDSEDKRVVNLGLDGTTLSFNGEFVEKKAIDVPSALKAANGNIDLLMSRSDLPKDVKMPIHFFEKAKNLSTDGTLRQKIIISGDIVNYHKNSKATLEQLCKENGMPVIQENSKRSIKLQLKMEDTSYIITGLRFKLDLSNCRNNLIPSLKLFNRTLNVRRQQNVPNMWFDVPFCDAEALYGSGSINNFMLELNTEDPKACPLRIISMEIFGLSKKDFNYKNKVKKLERVYAEKFNLSGAQAENMKQEEIVRQEMLTSKLAPLVSWKEKATFLQQCSKYRELAAALDIIAESVSSKVKFENLTELADTLKGLLQAGTSKTSYDERLVNSAAKRCLKAVLKSLNPSAPLGHPQNYHTFKDNLVVQTVLRGCSNLLELQGCLKGLFSIHTHRYYQLFDLLTLYPKLIDNLIQQYTQLETGQSDSKIVHRDLKELMALIIAGYELQVQNCVAVQADDPIEVSISKAYSNQEIAGYFTKIVPLMASSVPNIQKITISVILAKIVKYSDTMSRILTKKRLPQASFTVLANGQHQQVEKDVLIIDFAPHLLQFALGLIKEQGPALFAQKLEIVYQLAYKVAKRLELSISSLYNGSFLECLVDPIAAFFQSTIQPITSIEGQATGIDVYLYTNLVLFNCFVQRAMRDFKVNIKGSQVNFEAQAQKALIQRTIGQRGSLEQFFVWITKILHNYFTYFGEQKGSFRTKFEEGVPSSVVEVVPGLLQQGQKNLLKPIQESGPSWKWHPLFSNPGHQFELLDRKIPAQILLCLTFLIQEEVAPTIKQIDESGPQLIKQVFNAVAKLAFNKPAKIFLKQLGSLILVNILQYTKKHKTENILRDKVLLMAQKYVKVKFEGWAYFNEFYEAFTSIYMKLQGAPASYNLQFQVYQLLLKTWKKASHGSEDWQKFVNIKAKNRLNLATEYLFNSIFLLNEESAQLCMQLIALAFDSSVTLTFRPTGIMIEGNLFSVFQKSAQQTEGKLSTVKAVSEFSLDVRRLVQTMLVGRNKKSLRAAAAHAIKALYDCQASQQHFIKEVLLEQMPRLRTKGINSLEHLAVLSYVMNREIETHGASDDILTKKLTHEILKQVVKANQQLTGHENLEIYANLQKTCLAFQSTIEEDNEEERKAHEMGRLVMDRGQKSLMNPFLLETEACQKCYSQRSLPFMTGRLQDLKVEARSTDSCLVYRLNQSLQIKQLQLIQEQFRGNKVIKEVTLFVSNKQGIDLNEMKNNLALWQRVTTVDVEPGQRQILIDFTLPVTAQSLLVQFSTSNTSKIIHKQGQNPKQKREKAKKKTIRIESIRQVHGIDTVLSTLPKEIAVALGVVDGKDPIVKEESENEPLLCPRCGRQVQGRHGMCNQCGESAQQCVRCRNINYDKPDAFLCIECGASRFAQLELQIVYKPGLGAERIETEEQKTAALQQIEQNMQAAQTNYQNLMRRRTQIQGLVRTGATGELARVYQEECADCYQKMMKSLSLIKSLKIELEAYTGTEEPVTILKPMALAAQHSALSSPEDEQIVENCFSCIQEYLKGLLGFINATARSLGKLFQAEAFIDLLYKENIKMYSSQLQDPARQALCQLVRDDEAAALALLDRIQRDIFGKREVIPAHLVGSNIVQETKLVLELLQIQAQLKAFGKPHFYQTVLSRMWAIFFQALRDGRICSALAEQVAGTFMNNLKEKKIEEDAVVSLFTSTVDPVIKGASQTFLSGQNFLLFALTVQASQRLRTEAKDIVQNLLVNRKDLHAGILRDLMSQLGLALTLEAASGDQYFDLLQAILNPAQVKEIVTEDSLKPGSPSHIYVEAFNQLFLQLEVELDKLAEQETQRTSLGPDGFMPSISTGQIFSRVVSLVASLIKESPILKGLIQKNVAIVIKSFLRVRKLNLTKNKAVQQSEAEIEQIFKELLAQSEDGKTEFLFEGLKLIAGGSCDNKEMRFLLEEMCKVIDPVKPEPEYQLQLICLPSQQDYIRGRLKNPFISTQLGKTMGDVRKKICLECSVADPEVLELLVSGKIVNMDLTIRQVYEQVHWPALCTQRDPDAFTTPPIEEASKSSLTPMQVIYRLVGIEGEAQEDRVSSLPDSSELSPEEQERKFGVTKVLCREFEDSRKNGVEVLLDIFQSIISLQRDRYLAEWLFKLIGLALKIKSNRSEFLRHRETVDQFARRLFEALKFEELFDLILGILDLVISEIPEYTHDRMEIDAESENLEAAQHVQAFIRILADACTEMTANNKPLEQTSKKIRAVSKVLPFLINREDSSAQKIIIDFVAEALSKIPLLDNLAALTAKEKFEALFNLERVIDIFEAIPENKTFLKDAVATGCGPLLQSMWNYLLGTTMADLGNEAAVMKHKLANQYLLSVIYGLMKNHPNSQADLFRGSPGVIEKIYGLTQVRYTELKLTVISNDIVEIFTSEKHSNDPQAKDYLQKLVNKQKEDQKKLAILKRQQILAEMERKKQANKFLAAQQNLQEETGPKCIVCHEGYTKKPSEALGMYVFAKKLRSDRVQGYTTVTHSYCIHYTCHQNAYRADQQLAQPKKEWDGASIRNHHTKCNALLPLQGGSLPNHSYADMVERYFHTLQKSVGPCDSDRLKVIGHDLKAILKRLAYEDTFSRDTHGGGPEHNMLLIPFFVQMQYQLLMSQGVAKDGSFKQQKQIEEFLEQGVKQQKEAQMSQEEVKAGDDEDPPLSGAAGSLALDEICYMLTECIAFSQLPQWNEYKPKFLSIIVSTVANMSDEAEEVKPPNAAQTDFATGKRVLTLAKQADAEMAHPVIAQALGASGDQKPGSTRKRLTSDNKVEVLQRALIRIRPLLVLMHLIDSLKKHWNAKTSAPKLDAYLKKLSEDFLAKGNLQNVVANCDELFKEYKDRMLKLTSVEEFLQDLQLLEPLLKEADVAQALEKFVLSHF